MKLSIMGMGYVGVVSAACLVRDGHEVVGIDPVEAKIDDLTAGRSPVQEPGVAEMLADGHRAGRLKATRDAASGLAGSEMVWITVGTPSRSDGSVDLGAVEAAATQIGEHLRRTGERPLIVLRSTVPPGTTRTRFVPALERSSGVQAGREVSVAFHPEFLREGSAVADFNDPPKIVVGEADANAAPPLLALYERYPGPRFRLSLEEAELVKYSDNLFHAVKVTFANELGALARAWGVDARRVADVFCADTKLNISPRYLRPGFAFGGSCLPKDLRAILREAEVRGVRLPMLAGVPVSNSAQIETLLARVLERKPRRVGMVGLAFKPGTDDMRESPYVAVAKRLLGEGVELRVWDPAVHPERLIGRNRELVLAALAHLERLLVDSLAALDDCDLVLVNHATVSAVDVRGWLNRGAFVLDLAGVPGLEDRPAGYGGIAW